MLLKRGGGAECCLRNCTTRRTVSYKASGPDASGMYDASYSVVQGVGARRVGDVRRVGRCRGPTRRKIPIWTVVPETPHPPPLGPNPPPPPPPEPPPGGSPWKNLTVGFRHIVCGWSHLDRFQPPPPPSPLGLVVGSLPINECHLLPCVICMMEDAKEQQLVGANKKKYHLTHLSIAPTHTRYVSHVFNTHSVALHNVIHHEYHISCICSCTANTSNDTMHHTCCIEKHNAIY